jgi:ribonucleoside-diphosphate reductase alpha chain
MEITKGNPALPIDVATNPAQIPDDLRARPISLTDNARTVLRKRYLRRGEDGNPAETEQEMFWRVAYNVALPEATHGEDVIATARRFYDILTQLEFFPNSPTFTGAGTPLGQLAACFTADMRVTVATGQKRIADLQPGDLVLTHQGRYRPVKETYKREYSGKLLTIKVNQIGTPLEVTPEHPIQTMKGWVRAGDLKVGDWVALGYPKEDSNLVGFDLASLAYADNLEVLTNETQIRVRRPATYQNSGRQSQWIERFFPLSPELARLCGYYISEGTLGVGDRYIRFTFSKDEHEYHDDVLSLIEKIFGMVVTVRASNFGNWSQIDVYNRGVATWFKENFGAHAYGKFIPVWLQQASRPIQEEFLIGVFRGDGLCLESWQEIKGVNHHFRTLRLVLSNPSLISQIWQMGLRIGLSVSIRPYDATYVTPNARPAAALQISPESGFDIAVRAFNHAFSPIKIKPHEPIKRLENQAFLKIRKIEESDYVGTVYNCEVEEDNTYVTEGIVVHNCFVLKIDDDMGRNDTGIFQTLRNAALIQQTGGGNGFAFSRLRPKGAIVRSSNGQATGPVGFLRVYDQAFGEIAQGGCLTPDTLVHTEKGLLRLDEIVTHSEPGWREHTLTVATDEGNRVSTQGYNHGVVPVLRLTTAEGIQVTGTPNHKFKVMTATGGVWKRLDQLQPGDAIMVKLGQHRGEPQQLVHPMKQHGNQVMLTFPTILHEEFAYFLGLIAMGQIRGDKLTLNIPKDSFVVQTIQELMPRLFGENNVIAYYENKRLTIDLSQIKKFLALNGLNPTESNIPRLIRQSPPRVIEAYLTAIQSLFPQNEIYCADSSLQSALATLIMGMGYPVILRGQTLMIKTPQLVTRGKPLPENMGIPKTQALNDWTMTVQSVEPAGKALTLDMEVEDNHTYLANGLVTHNSRRGANMAVLRVDHPDVREFITCKTDESKITNFNISVGITDKFMRAVEQDGMFDLINPQDGKVWETVRAREIFDLIVKHAHHNGEPGVLFLDAANRQNPVPHLYELESTNPCGEQFLGPFENCCLGSINLVDMVTPDGKVDWAKLQTLTEDTTRFLDDVVSANKYVPAVPQLEKAAHAVRRIGLGVMGLGDLMYKLGVRYGSEQGQEFAGQIMEFVRYHAMLASIRLAEKRGAFPAIKGSIYDPAHLKWTPPTPLFPYTRNWERPVMDWSVIVEGIKQHGIRNGAQLTVAPTGTIATVSGCEAYGCEPVFALAYIRHVNDKGQDLQLQYTSPLFEKALIQAGVSEAQIKAIVEQVNLTGSCQTVPGVPDSVRHTFVVSSDVTAEEHVRMQAAMQAFVDNAISKTINAPETFLLSDVANVYMLGWKLGCKGMTVYVTGSREKVVLETHATAKQKEAPAAEVALTPTPEPTPAHAPEPPKGLKIYGAVKKARARVLTGRTFQVGTPLGKTYVTINENGEGRGQPFEIFTHTSKAGSETAAVSEAIGRLISLVLRIASPISPRERLQEIVAQLTGIGGGRSAGFGASRVRSLPDGIAQVLQEYLDMTDETQADAVMVESAPVETKVNGNGHHATNGKAAATARLGSGVGVTNGKIVGDLCPECGEATLINEEGCRKCYTCNYSEC